MLLLEFVVIALPLVPPLAAIFCFFKIGLVEISFLEVAVDVAFAGRLRSMPEV